MLLSSAHADAASNGVVISHIQAGAASGQQSAAMQEFVVLYNGSSQDVDVTNWCVNNNRTTPVVFACIKPASVNQSLYLSAHSYMTIVSDHFSVQHENYVGDVIFQTTNNSSGSINASSEMITLKNAQGVEVDAVGQAAATFALSGGFVFQRKTSIDAVTLIDTDSLADFVKVQGITLPIGGLYEIVTDACSNIDGVQSSVPVGSLADANGQCFEDACTNIVGLQLTIPEEYVRRDMNDCAYDYVALKITELLPNAAGSDTGREFVELYNPSNRTAFLINYLLKVGGKTYNFPAGLKMDPGQYMAFYNNEVAFTLVNTTGEASILGDDGSRIDESDAYESAGDDMSWALIGETWQYTNQLTFAGANIASVIMGGDEEEAVSLQPCATNQYRHPETKRCRLLVTVATIAAACKDGQYRSEETNRCRTIALAGGTLTPCKEGQYRSEETNRCRSLATLANTLTPCKDNQYRSEETNRCRNIITTAVPQAAFAVEPIAETRNAFVGWYALGGVGALAIGYGAWEWRREVVSVLYRIASFFTKQ